MAIKAVQIYLKHTEEYSDESKRLIVSTAPAYLGWIQFCVHAQESKKINDSHYPRSLFLPAEW